MNTLDPTAIVKTLRDLPALQPVLMQLVQSFEQPEANLGWIAQGVARDQALAAKTLRLANSSFYGLQSQVRTIQQAITVLGFDTMRSMIMAAGIIDNFSQTGENGFDFRGFWQHAIGVALSARSLAGHANLNPELGFMCGLLHDIGTLVLVTKFPQQHAAVLAYRQQTDCHLLDAERHVLGTDHAAVGSRLAEHWRFPLLIQKALANHHAPQRDDFGGLASVVHVADAVAHALDLSAQEEDLVPPMSEAAWDSLAMNDTRLHAVFRATETDFKEACRILSP